MQASLWSYWLASCPAAGEGEFQSLRALKSKGRQTTISCHISFCTRWLEAAYNHAAYPCRCIRKSTYALPMNDFDKMILRIPLGLSIS